MIDIDGFKEYLYEEELAPNTIATYVKGVEKYAERFDTITKPNLIEFKRYLVENYKPQTVNLRLSQFHTSEQLSSPSYNHIFFPKVRLRPPSINFTVRS